MKKQKHHKYTWLVMAGIVFSFVLSVNAVFTANLVSAASPGCYTRAASGSGTQIDAYACPTSGYTSSVNTGQCFVFVAGPNGISDTGVATDCDSITVGTNVSESPDQISSSSDGDAVEFKTVEGQYQCGTNENAVATTINFGCKGVEIEASGGEINPIVDMAFAIFRFLSAGVGLVIVGSVIFAGIQYSASRGNPQAVEASMKRITNNVIALLFYALLFSIANFLVPGGMFI